MAHYHRIVVVGCTGSGKTTSAQIIAARCGLPRIELDALHWDAGWSAAPAALFRARVAQAVAGQAWVLDGNYSQVRDLVWDRAELVVWLDFALPVIVWRLLVRSIRRIRTREELWNGNREDIRGQFFSRDSLFVAALRSHARQRNTYAALFGGAQYAHLARLRLRTPAAADAWLAQLPGVLARPAAV